MQLALLLRADPPAQRMPPGWGLFLRLRGRSSAEQPVDAGPLLAGVPVLPAAGASADAIRKYNLDFVLQLVEGDWPATLGEAVRYGLWAFHHGDEEKYRGGPPCFWEFYHGNAITPSSLLRRTADGECVLRKGYFKTLTHSFAQNLDQVCMEGARWPAQVCSDLQSGFAGYITAPGRPPAPALAPPTLVEVLQFAVRTAMRSVGNILRNLFRDAEWNIGIVEAPVQKFLEPGFQPKIRWLPGPARGHFSADPFVIARDGQHYVFYEDYDFRRCKGQIHAVELRNGQTVGPPAEVFDLPVHLSYPFPIEDEGNLYCIPCMSDARDVLLYRALELPHRWERCGNLLPGVAAIDSTVFRHEGRWWLLCTLEAENEDPNVNLYAWHAERLLGPWQSHRVNPVKTDVRSARPAGPAFTHNGALYRPAQDCSRTYGGRVVLQRIIRLTPDEFREEPVRTIEPAPTGPYPDGLHTLCGIGDFTVVDGKRFIFNADSFRHALHHYVHKSHEKLFGARAATNGPP